MKKKLVQLFSLLFLVVFFGSNLITIDNTQAAPPEDLDRTLVVGDLNQPTAFRFLPDGRLLIAEKAGAIKIFANGVVQPDPLVTIVTLPTEDADERGLLGIEPDPDFATNGYLYVSYTTAANRDRLARVTVIGDSASLASEIVLAESDQDGRIYHHGGEVQVGPDDKLYWAMGMNTDNNNSQNLSNVHGKIHRLNKDGSIPIDNPFYNTPNAVKSIWAYGIRNPFRFDFLPNGKPVVGDVGGNKWEEVDIIERGANYGWPLVEGACTDCPYANPVFAYPHTPPPDTAGSITAALLYEGDALGSEYDGAFFYGDYTLGFIRYLKFDSNYESVLEDKLFDDNAGTIVQLTQGPDGSLYQMNIYPGEIYKIAPSGGNRTPAAQASADPTAGLAPMTVALSSAGSSDPDGTTLGYSWDFGDGNSSTDPNPTHEYTSNGTYLVTLTVSDGAKQDTATTTVTVGNRLPTATILTPVNNSLYQAGQTVSFSGAGTDPEDGALGEASFSWEFVFHHADHTHPFSSTINGVKTGSFTIPTTADNTANTWYRIKLTVTDAGGLKHTTFTEVKPQLINLTFNTQPANTQITVDGIPHTGQLSEQAVVGVQRVLDAPSPQYIGSLAYAFTGWSDGGIKTHVITTPATDTTYTASFLEYQIPPAPWVATDIGSPAQSGNAAYADGQFVVSGAGIDIWGSHDQMQYVYQPLSGDGEIVAKVVSQTDTDDWAKSGIIVKAKAEPFSPYALLAVTPANGLVMQHSFNQQVSSGSYSLPVWLKLKRSGNTVLSFRSTDGTNWTQVGTATLTLPETVTVGLFVNSHNGGLQNTTIFEDVSVQNTLPAPWQASDIGNPDLAGDTEAEAGSFTLTGAGNDIWGDTDQFQYAYQNIVGDVEIIARATALTTDASEWTKAGVMIKESANPLSPYALLAITPEHGVVRQANFNQDTSGGTYTLPNAWLKLKRTGNSFATFSSTDGSSWTPVGGALTLTMSPDVTVGLFITSHNGSKLASVTLEQVSVVKASASNLPSGWSNLDIGSMPISGSANFAQNTFTVKGSGADVWETTDQLHYAYQTLLGDGQIIARVKSQDNTDSWAKSGVMIKQSATTGAPYVFMAVTPGNGYALQSTPTQHTAGGAYIFPNAWVKLVRSGNNIAGFVGSDGTNWTLVGNRTLALAEAVTIGLAVTAHNNGLLNTTTFDNVVITTGSALPAPWSASDIGFPQVPGSTAFNSSTFTVTGGGTDVWGSLDQLHYTHQPLTGDGEIIARVASQTNSDGWAKAGVMIKENTTTGSPYSFLAVTPEHGVAFQSNFNTHTSGGAYSFPNTWLKLNRIGNDFKAYTSTDGTNWTLVGTQTVTMSANVTIGLAVTAHNWSSSSTALFQSVTVTP